MVCECLIIDKNGCLWTVICEWLNVNGLWMVCEWFIGLIVNG